MAPLPRILQRVSQPKYATADLQGRRRLPSNTAHYSSVRQLEVLVRRSCQIHRQSE